MINENQTESICVDRFEHTATQRLLIKTYISFIHKASTSHAIPCQSFPDDIFGYLCHSRLSSYMFFSNIISMCNSAYHPQRSALSLLPYICCLRQVTATHNISRITSVLYCLFKFTGIVQSHILQSPETTLSLHYLCNDITHFSFTVDPRYLEQITMFPVQKKLTARTYVKMRLKYGATEECCELGGLFIPQTLMYYRNLV